MRLLLLITLGTLLNEGVDSKCDTLLMCPTFCMKVQKGCYVCDCGTFSSYLRQASDKMAEKSHTQQQQTGTRLSYYTSGYGITGHENEMSRTSNDQRVQDYTNMMELGLQFMNVQARPIVRQNAGVSSPGFINYGNSYQNMPGMNCAPVETKCPSSCWNTNVYTGCVHCACGDRFPNSGTIQATPSSQMHAQQTTSVKHFENLNHINNTGNFDTSPASFTESISNSTNKDKPLNNTVTSIKTDSMPNIYSIRVPTKPPTRQTHGNIGSVSNESFTKFANQNKTTLYDSHIRIPTLPPQKVIHPAFPTMYPLGIKSSLNQNQQYKQDQGLLSHVGYPTPAFIPETVKVASTEASNRMFYPKDEYVLPGHNEGAMSQALGSKAEAPTNISYFIDHLRDDTAKFTLDKKQQIKQPDVLSILNSLRSPLNTVMSKSDQTPDTREEILLNQSPPYIGHGDYNTSNAKSGGMNNNVGFYGHIKTG